MIFVILGVLCALQSVLLNAWINARIKAKRRAHWAYLSCR